ARARVNCPLATTRDRCCPRVSDLFAALPAGRGLGCQAVNVEKLLTATDEDGRRRDLYVTEAKSFEDWRATLNEQSLPKQGDDGFALLLVADATDVDTTTVADLADWCIDKGLFSVSVW